MEMDGGVDSESDSAEDGGDFRDGLADGGGQSEPAIWCSTQWPLMTSTASGYDTEILYVQLWVEGVTPSGGKDFGLEVELGVGPAWLGPEDGAWHWTSAEFNPHCAACGENEEWMGEVRPIEAGESLWAGRVRYQNGAWVYCDRADEGRLGSSDAWSGANAPRVVVSEPGALRVLSINLRCLLDDWTRRLPVLVAGIVATDPDLLGFQEVCAEVQAGDNLGELLSALDSATGKTYQVVRTVTHFSWDRYDEGLAVVSPHRIGTSRIVDLPAGIFPRRAIFSHVITPQGPVVFATTHLDHQSSESRAQQIQSLQTALDSFVHGQEAIILTGDFNEAPGGAVCSTMTQAGYTDVWSYLRSDQYGFSFPSSQPQIRIDYFWFKSGLSDFVPESIDLIFTQALDGVYASDHLGLSAQVSR